MAKAKVEVARARAERWGVRAERLAALWLRIAGWRVLERRYRVPVGEIDLIACRGRSLAFIEVKARADHAAALDAVGPHKRRRVERAAAAFLSAHPEWRTVSPRFDVMVLGPWRLPRHLKDAWRPDWP
jgi:putative endonuclease